MGEDRGSGSEGFVRTRSYNISITYDKYYQVPRCWLFGYDEDSKPLTHEQVFQDMSQVSGGVEEEEEFMWWNLKRGGAQSLQGNARTI